MREFEHMRMRYATVSVPVDNFDQEGNCPEMSPHVYKMGELVLH